MAQFRTGKHALLKNKYSMLNKADVYYTEYHNCVYVGKKRREL